MSDVPRVTMWAPPFAPVESVDQLGAGDGHHCVTLFPGAARLPPVKVYAVAGAVFGGNGLIRVGGEIFGIPDAIPGYYRDVHAVWYKRLLEDAGEVIRFETPVISVVQPNWVYGHVILEMLPKMFLADLLGRFGRAFPVVVTRHAPPFLREILSLYFREADIVFYDPDTQRVAAPFVIVPSMMNWYYDLHPAMELMIDDLVERCRRREGRAAAPRIFLSRSRLPSGNEQRVQDPAALDEIFLRHGFAIVHPQELGFVQQMLMYAQADIIAGVAGSALHNSMFQRKGGTVISIGTRNELQDKLTRFRGQALHFIDPPSRAPSAEGPVPSQPFDAFATRLGDLLSRHDGGAAVNEGLHLPAAWLLQGEERQDPPDLDLFRDDLLWRPGMGDGSLGGYSLR